MRKIVADEWVTLDGVVQAPGNEQEDTDGGFRHGGWHMRYVDESVQQSVLEDLESAGGFVLGRRTYEIFASYWPTAPPEEQVVAEPLNSKPKYVASTTLTGPLAWRNSTVLQDDVATALAALKQEDGGDLHVIGSSELLHTLIGNDLVDELHVTIDPVVVGGGKRLFADDGVLRSFELAEIRPTSTGALMTTYVLPG